MRRAIRGGGGLYLASYLFGLCQTQDGLHQTKLQKVDRISQLVRLFDRVSAWWLIADLSRMEILSKDGSAMTRLFPAGSNLAHKLAGQDREPFRVQNAYKLHDVCR